MILLDASAVLALVLKEPGADAIVSPSSEFCISPFNYAEAGSALVNRAYSPGESRTILELLRLNVIPVETEILHVSIDLREKTRTFGLSLGDRLCLATAKFYEIPVFTADTAWKCMKKIDADIDIRFIR